MTKQNEPMSSNGTGMISGCGKFYSNKNGDKPYLRISLKDIRRLVDNPSSVPKDNAQWIIPSTFDTRVHAEQELHGEFLALWADVDWKHLTARPMAEVASIVDGLIGADVEIYASRSATEDRQKCRVLIPLEKPLCGSDWILAQRVLNSLLLESGVEPDTASEGPGQLLYLPNRGDWYDSISRREGVYFDPLTAWADYISDLRRKDAEEAAATRAARDAAKKRREAFRAETVGADAQSLIQAFNKAFLVEEILVRAGYAQRGNHFRHPNSETGSFSASVKDGRVHSLSTADPLWTDTGAHDAFSAFSVLFHQGDRSAALREAGDNWIKIGAESWNQVSRRKYAEDRKAGRESGGGADAGNCRPGAFSLKHFSIRGKSKQMHEQMLKDVFVLGRLALLGQVTHFYAAPGSGKTLITMWLLAGAIESGAINAGNVFYINCDDNHKGLTIKTELAEQLGFEMLAPGYEGFNVKDFAKYIQAMIDDDSARGIILILDTVKKFTTLMSKTEGAAFGTVLREFSMKGGTVIGLAHVNKHPGPDGKPIYEGTADLRNDADCTYILDVGAVDDEFRTVIFTNDKNRGDVAAEASYRYLFKPSVPWIKKYESIRTLGEDQVARIKAQKATDEKLALNADAIDAVIAVLAPGPLNKGELMKRAANESGIGTRRIHRAIKAHCGEWNQYGQFWTERKTDENNAYQYSLNSGAESFWSDKKSRLGGGV